MLFSKSGFLPCLLASTLSLAAMAGASATGEEEEIRRCVITIHNEALFDGEISPLLFGNFIELLNDVAPAMWAEMLNDRSFEGVEPLSRGIYFDGKPDFCDRPWEANKTWEIDQKAPFNGQRCARLRPSPDRPAILAQSGLAVKAGMTYNFTGYFRSTGATVAVTARLKTLLPDGSWFTLASAQLPPLADGWQKVAANLISTGQSDRVVFEVSAEGDGLVWADKLSLMPKDRMLGWRRDVVDLVRELRPPIIRWGGSILDPGGYEWKKGIGDRDLRTPFKDPAWGRIDPNDVGIDEFCQFCELVGAPPLICVSFADGAESAGDLVEYCNGGPETPWGRKRSENGHPAPYGVKYWQVGNEIRGNDADYLGQILDFIHAIKKSDATAQVMSSFPAQELLDAAGPELAYICPHQYTRDLSEIDSSLRNLEEMIDSTPGSDHLLIGVTEWNVSGGDWGLMRGRQATLGTAIRNARHLQVMMRHGRKVRIANRSNMANSFCGATFETNPAGILKRPSHFVMELYTHHVRPFPFRVDEAAGGLDVFACGSSDHKQVTVFVVNPEDHPVDARVQGVDFPQTLRAVSGETVCDTKDARERDIMNHWEAPDRVRLVETHIPGKAVLLPAYSITAIECAVSE